MKHYLICLALALPAPLWAAGSDDPVSSPPKETKTTKECKGVKVWDEDKQRCVRPKESSLSPSQLGDAVRELAYAGRYEDAQGVLRALPDPQSDLALTYWGFTARKLGDVDAGMAFYAQALARNPDNLLARSYLGQAHVEAGRMMAARSEMREIVERGGAETWAGQSLRAAIETGQTYNY